MRALVFQHVACEHPGVFREFLREDGIEIHTAELDEGDPIPDLEGFDALLVMGGPMNVWQKSAHPWLVPEIAAIRNWVVAGRPFLGFCLGHQLLAEALGGEVGPAGTPEIGVMTVDLTEAGGHSPFLAGVPRRFPCFQWHSAEITRAPEGAQVLASSPACRVNAMSWGHRAFSIQFHVEITSATVGEWGLIPEYAQALEEALGVGALARLEADAARQISAFNAISRQIYRNFMEVSGER